MRTKGFTLIELMVVIVVIGIVLAFSIPSMNTTSKKFDNNYRNIADKLKYAKQIAVTKNTNSVVYTQNDKVILGNDVLELYNGITLNVYSGGASIDSITFLPSGGTVNDAFVVIDGFGRTDSIIVTISGFVLTR